MSQQQRKQNLFGVQDWQSIYQTFRDADFKSYDYETLRKSMIDYLRLYHPENFNDYINSSEYVALIDLIAFMGQSMSFRMDLNARENFLETARRRDNVLRLAKLVNYEAKRNLPSQGYLRIEAVRTNEVVRDTQGNDLSNLAIRWNDINNINWRDQWNSILNAAITSSQRVGRPGNTANIDGITTSEYSIDIPAGGGIPFIFTSVVDNIAMNFEAINPTVKNSNTVRELGADVSTVYNLLYRDDQRGFASNNTGYFVYFKQGTLLSEEFTVLESVPNRQFTLQTTGVNNNDIWLYKVNTDGTLTEWSRVDSVNGYNTSYNNYESTNKKVFSVTSLADDGATLVFGDGVFSEIPVGDFVCYYRISNGLNYRVNPGEMSNVVLNIPYVSKNGRTQTLTVTANLKYTVANSAARENINDIKTRAPQSYYTQNRMVNGQDYNSLPFAKYSNILKIKSVNRTSSGVSRYLDVIDNTGRYSSTNIVCDDGFVYKDTNEIDNQFTFATRDDIVENVNTLVIPAVQNSTMLNFFYGTDDTGSTKNYSTENINSNLSSAGYPTNTYVDWNLVLVDNDISSGYLNLVQPTSSELATTAATYFDNKFRVGAVLKFEPPSGRIFDYENRLVSYNGSVGLNQKTEIYATVRSISQFGRGTRSGSSVGVDTDGTGAIVLSEKVPTGARLTEILPTYNPNLPSDIQTSLVNALVAQKNVALGYRAGSTMPDSVGDWFLIENPSVNGNFIEPSNTDSTNINGWLIAFTNTSNTYTVRQRSIQYFFGSEKQTRFFFDPQVKIYDPASGKLLKDRIDVLKVNYKPTSVSVTAFSNDITMGISGVVIEGDGFVDDTKIQVTYADKDSDGSPDQPYFYDDIVGTVSSAGAENSYVFFVNDQEQTGSSMRVLSKGTVKIAASEALIDSTIYEYSNNDVVFSTDTETFFRITRTSSSVSKSTVTNYVFKYGRYGLKFQYRHNAPSDRRIDPSPSNIIDIYVLEKNYADDYTRWIRDFTGTVAEPVEPTTESLRNDFSDLEQYRMISDLIIFNPVKFKPLFGSKADPNLRAKFVVVKNPNVVVSDSEIKSQVITKVNEYFTLDNWDFGETFYFSELAAYLHNQLNSIISSVHLVPTSTDQTYGDLQQIRCLPYEILISAAIVTDVEVVTNLTTVKLRAGN
jgi:hypothetical protein